MSRIEFWGVFLYLLLLRPVKTVSDLSDVFLPSIDWNHGLSSVEMVQNFTSNSAEHGMARETVTLWNKSSVETIAVMGVNVTPPFTLADCLSLTKRTRKIHGIQLVFEIWEAYQVAKYDLQDYPEPWIWLHFDVVQGTNATLEHLIDPEAVEKAAKTMANKQKISLGWTAAISELHFNYSGKALKKMNRFLHTSKNMFRRDVVLVVDGHLITLYPDAKRIITSFNAVVKNFLFYVKEKDVHLEQLTILKEILHAVGTTICYLDAPGNVKKALKLNQNDPPKPTKRYHSVRHQHL